jgi:hypothetical protein
LFAVDQGFLTEDSQSYITAAKKDRRPKKPGKVWVSLDYIPKTTDDSRERSFKAEQGLLEPHRDKWDVLASIPS